MEHFLTTLPGIVIAWAAIIGGIISGILYVMGLWKGKKDNADDRLITILQTTVEELEKKVNKQSTDIDELTKQVGELKRDNAKYIDIFKGRDSQTQEFYKQGFESMKTANQIHDTVTTMAESIKNTNDSLKSMGENMTKMIELLGKHLEVLDHAASSKV